MVAIAMTREMGTLGKDVAQGIAASLGLKVIHRELVEHDTCVRIVRLLTDDPAFQENQASRALLADKLIEARVRTVLDEQSIGSGPDIAVDKGNVTLSVVVG